MDIIICTHFLGLLSKRYNIFFIFLNCSQNDEIRKQGDTTTRTTSDSNVTTKCTQVTILMNLNLKCQVKVCHSNCYIFQLP